MKSTIVLQPCRRQGMGKNIVLMVLRMIPVPIGTCRTGKQHKK